MIPGEKFNVQFSLSDASSAQIRKNTVAKRTADDK